MLKFYAMHNLREFRGENNLRNEHEKLSSNEYGDFVNFSMISSLSDQRITRYHAKPQKLLCCIKNWHARIFNKTLSIMCHLFEESWAKEARELELGCIYIIYIYVTLRYTCVKATCVILLYFKCGFIQPQVVEVIDLI